MSHKKTLRALVSLFTQYLSIFQFLPLIFYIQSLLYNLKCAFVWIEFISTYGEYFANLVKYKLIYVAKS